jgi:hypothetical protein
MYQVQVNGDLSLHMFRLLATAGTSLDWLPALTNGINIIIKSRGNNNVILCLFNDYVRNCIEFYGASN